MQENHTPGCSPLFRAALLAGLAWPLTPYGLYSWNVHREIALTTTIASSQTRSFFKEFLMTCFWNVLHGGVYVPVTRKTKPNPYLQEDPDRDLSTPSSRPWRARSRRCRTRPSSVLVMITGIRR